MHPEDRNYLKQQLIPKDLETLFDVSTNENGEPAQRTEAEEHEIDAQLKADKRNFTIR